jgi:UDP-2,3-diacylglucosamine pyrophosphatase LpxH
MKVVKYLMGLITKGTMIYYITGNHDEMLRKFVGLIKISSFQLVNKVALELDGKQAWFFHGDVFNVTMQHCVGLSNQLATLNANVPKPKEKDPWVSLS